MKTVKKKATELNIPLSSLRHGEHLFQFTVNSSLFSENQYTDIHAATLVAEVRFDKNSYIMTFNFTITGNVNVTCDLCGEDFDMPVSIQKKLIVKTESSEHQEEEDMICLCTGETDLDVAPYIYQYVALSLPMQRIHPTEKNGKSNCNKATIDKLNNIHVKTSNDENYLLNNGMHFSDVKRTLKHNN